VIYLLKGGLNCKVETPIVSKLTLKLIENSISVCNEELLVDLSPAVTVDDKVNFNRNAMETGTYYPFSYRNQKYLATKSSDKIIEIYKIKK
jgi:hypothetical protein